MRIVDPAHKSCAVGPGRPAAGRRESLRMGGGASKPTTKEADGIFKKIDANNDGKLTVDELTIAAMQ